MRWSEIDLERRVWALPGSRTKNHRDHTVPLSGPALAIIAARPRQPDRDLIFGSGQKAFSGWSNAKYALDARLRASGAELPEWRVHDVRRGVATHMGEIGILPHVIEAILNHVSGHKGGVAGIYNRAAYEDQVRTALDRWAEWLMAMVEERDSNVVPMARA